MENLYGVFQLSDEVACTSASVPTLNICNMNCAGLIDDDITDDVACLKTLLSQIKPKNIVRVAEIVDELFGGRCNSVVYSKYFTGCA
ncbi:hypothetical protein DNTS_002237 [Danionella cerebrum]|uniref:lysozyme n=1 Tax=Danionella cerebrum TaxID=2873325 RepID=A0A553RN28_9TELE|nr:hypothetical protein DNTS_002237 [Danionella translucida]